MFFQKAYKSQNILATIVSKFEAENFKKLVTMSVTKTTNEMTG